ncbi:MAG: hypothetical protein HQ478_06795 [Chloroflexi bacterium]|nr:hypothetical protein [Chloroflexota bacterium]
MATERLELRLDGEQRRRLDELAEEEGTAVSETVRRLIDRAYEETLNERRKRAAEEIGQLEVEDVPEPETVTRQLEGAHESGSVH